MRKLFLTGVAAIALTAAGSAYADEHLMFKPSEGPFNWGSFDTFAVDHDYSSQTSEHDRAMDR